MILKRARNVFWLATRDYRNEWQMSGFFVLALVMMESQGYNPFIYFIF